MRWAVLCDDMLEYLTIGTPAMFAFILNEIFSMNLGTINNLNGLIVLFWFGVFVPFLLTKSRGWKEALTAGNF